MNSEKKRQYNREYMRRHRLENPEFGRWKDTIKAREARKRWRAANLDRDNEQTRKANRRARGAKNPSGELKHGPCEICEKVCDLHYDHNHNTGEFRGWLCGPCNRGIGAFKENTATLKRAIEYLGANCVADYAERILEQREAVVA